ncbi:MAG: septum formation initiator family protein [Firmicutes bacterium]|nr:septum formation initiator family protein [Bacillota bacterium]MBQ6012937.1 septum formation initiator family protein [Bacillota bacterium]MBQ6260999.1 septum formation initiator family protein [Bacillota bacterium]MBR0114698.1 septum formation initiator family protein [Bacillota bacterium]MBR0442010.1 septum formation initiator family protein [Bacillota bacterium]
MSRYTDDDMLRDWTSEAQKERQAQRAKLREEQEELLRRQKKTRRRRRGFLIKAMCVAAVMVAVLFAAFSTMDIFQLQEQKRQADEELQGLEHRKLGLEQELEIVESDEYVEQQARSELRMIYDGEVLYVVKDQETQENQGEMPEQVKP